MGRARVEDRVRVGPVGQWAGLVLRAGLGLGRGFNGPGYG